MRKLRRASKTQEKGENSRPILEKLFAFRSFSGRLGSSTAKKWFDRCVQSNWDPQEDQQPFRPNPNGVGDRTIKLRRLLIGAD